MLLLLQNLCILLGLKDRPWARPRDFSLFFRFGPFLLVGVLGLLFGDGLLLGLYVFCWKSLKELFAELLNVHEHVISPRQLLSFDAMFKHPLGFRGVGGKKL
jgi:hypothetical protein